MAEYNVNIYKFVDDAPDGFQQPHIHLSNPALYVTPADDGSTTVSFTDPTGNADGWKIYFRNDVSPFYVNDPNPNTPVGLIGNPITKHTKDMQITDYAANRPGDYNYTVLIGNIKDPEVSEDPQVIIGGRGSGGFRNWGRLGSASGVAAAAGIAGLVLGFLVYRAVGGRA